MAEAFNNNNYFTPKTPSHMSSKGSHSRYKSNGGFVHHSINFTSPLAHIKENLSNQRQNANIAADLYLPHLKPKMSGNNTRHEVRNSMVVTNQRDRLVANSS